MVIYRNHCIKKLYLLSILFIGAFSGCSNPADENIDTVKKEIEELLSMYQEYGYEDINVQNLLDEASEQVNKAIKLNDIGQYSKANGRLRTAKLKLQEVRDTLKSIENLDVERKQIHDVQSTIGAIYNAAKMYEQDNGKAPESIELLEDSGYLKVESLIKLYWTFNFEYEGTKLSKIKALSINKTVDGNFYEMNYDIKTKDWNWYGFKDQK